VQTWPAGMARTNWYTRSKKLAALPRRCLTAATG
jgi:hypothetical protein